MVRPLKTGLTLPTAARSRDYRNGLGPSSGAVRPTPSGQSKGPRLYRAALLQHLFPAFVLGGLQLYPLTAPRWEPSRFYAWAGQTSPIATHAPAPSVATGTAAYVLPAAEVLPPPAGGLSVFSAEKTQTPRWWLSGESGAISLCCWSRG